MGFGVLEFKDADRMLNPMYFEIAECVNQVEQELNV